MTAFATLSTLPAGERIGGCGYLVVRGVVYRLKLWTNKGHTRLLELLADMG